MLVSASLFPAAAGLHMLSLSKGYVGGFAMEFVLTGLAAGMSGFSLPGFLLWRQMRRSEIDRYSPTSSSRQCRLTRTVHEKSVLLGRLPSDMSDEDRWPDIMFTALKRMFSPKPQIGHAPVSNLILGCISFSEEDGAWLTEPSHGALRFRIHIAGVEAPDARLLAHAEAVARDPISFRAMVSDFLEQSAKQMKDEDDTVRKLEIESLCLFWPDRPDDGMIFFLGGEKYRAWRCDYKNRKPIGLGFDS